jgi:glucokinase
MAAKPESTGAVLLADVGGTNARFAMIEDGIIGDIRTLAASGHSGIADAARTYLAGRCIGGAAIAVAGPVPADEDTPITLTNRAWSFSAAGIRAALGGVPVRIVNDFAAQALALPHLGPADLEMTGGGKAAGNAPKAVLGPGTGLGMAVLLPENSGWRALATEGGHVTLAASTDAEAAVLSRLRARFGHVSAERVLSGPGLVNLHEALAGVEGTVPEADTPDGVTAAALAAPGSLAGRTVSMFCAFLGTVAADAALSYAAAGGVYIAGGIVPKLGSGFASSGFRTRFEAKGRFSAWLAEIPTFTVVAPYPAFAGLAALVRELRAQE